MHPMNTQARKFYNKDDIIINEIQVAGNKKKYLKGQRIKTLLVCIFRRMRTLFIFAFFNKTCAESHKIVHIPWYDTL
jgi:hypothetical protein